MKTSERTFWKKYIANAQLDLSIAAYSKVTPDWTQEDHTPGYNRMYFIREGEGYVKLRGRVYYPKPGDLYILPAGQVQAYGLVGDDPFGKYWCHFNAKIGDLELFQVIETPAFVRVSEPEALKERFEELLRHVRSDALTSEFRVRSILLELIAEFLEQAEPVKLNMAAAPSFEKMSAVLRHIETHLASSLTVDELAQIAHFHPNYFIRVFRHYTGQSPIQYINRIRLEKAKHLLTVTELNVSQIADAVGMEFSYFSRVFREHTGYTPTGYRDGVPRMDPAKEERAARSGPA